MKQNKAELKNPKRFYKEVGLVLDPNKRTRSVTKKVTKKDPKPSEFVQKLEAEANKPRAKKFKFSKVMCEELDYYINKYGDDYERMARDRKNIYQDSPGQLRYKIIKYKKIHLKA